MLSKFAVTNYRGFEKRIELDLSNPNDYEFNKYAVNNKTIKNGIIFGENGCGKSNFGLAIFDIVNHLTQKWKKNDYYENFVFAGAINSPVIFEYTFNFDDTLIEYFYSKNLYGVLQDELLKVNQKVIFSKKEKNLIIDNNFPLDESIKQKLSNNANNISVVNYLISSFPLEKNHYLIKLQSFIDSMLWFKNLDERQFIGLDTQISNIDQYIIENNLVNKFSKFIFNVSKQKFNFVKHKKGDKELLCLIKNCSIPFNLIASTGTRSLELLFFWITKLNNASFVFIDEFDAFYHFELSFNVCKELFNLNCQLFTSSHNTFLMTNDLLRPDCNFILKDGVIKSLYNRTQKELRFGHNIEKLYRGGTFTNDIICS